jgi:hypothetical protein
MNLHWFETAILHHSTGWIPAFNIQSLSGFILRLHPDAPLTEWAALLPSPGQKLAAQVLTGIVVLVALAACLPRRATGQTLSAQAADERLALQFSIVICLCLLISPLTWAHYFAWLLVPTALFLGSRSAFAQSPLARAGAWAAIILITPIDGLPIPISHPQLLAVYKSVLVSHVLIGGLIWLGLLSCWLACSGGLLTRFAPSPVGLRSRAPDPA